MSDEGETTDRVLEITGDSGGELTSRLDVMKGRA